MTYYISPTGIDTNAGTDTAPMFQLMKAYAKLAVGDTLICKPGTYKYKAEQTLTGKNGVSGNMIKVFGTGAVFTSEGTFATDGALIYFEGSYVHFKGLELTGFRSPSGRYAFHSEAANNCLFELFNVHHNRSSMGIRGNSNNNEVLNCDFFFNADPENTSDPFGGADGFNFSLIPNVNAVNVIRGCRARGNSDDGFDTWGNQGSVLFENCWAWNQGFIEGGTQPAGDGSGFKLGQVGIEDANGQAVTPYNTLKRTLKNCIAVNNRNWGFNDNRALCKIEVINCTSIGNGKWNYVFGWDGPSSTTLTKNISYKSGGHGGQQDLLEPVKVTLVNNSWQGKTVTDTDFASLDINQLSAPRKADGSLPDITYLKVVQGSDLVGLGHTQGTIVVPPVVLPTANAGLDATVPLANAPNVALSGTGTGTAPIAYKWVKISGSGNITSPNTATTGITGLVAGVSVFELQVTDVNGTKSDQVTITVLPASTDVIIPCTAVYYDNGTTQKRIAATQIVLKADGFYYVSGTKRDIVSYKDGKWKTL